MSTELASQHQKLRDVQDKLAHDERKVDALAKYDADLLTCVKILEDWEADIARLREARARHEQHLADRAGLEEEHADIQNNIKVLSSKLTNAVEALGRFNQKTEDKREALRQRKAGLEATQRDLLGRKAVVAEKAAERNREAMKVEDEVSTGDRVFPDGKEGRARRGGRVEATDLLRRGDARRSGRCTPTCMRSSSGPRWPTTKYTTRLSLTVSPSTPRLTRSTRSTRPTSRSKSPRGRALK